MTYESTILADSPTAYFPLTESGTAIGSVYADATGHGYGVTVTTGTLTHTSGPITGETAPLFPVGPSYDGLLGSVTAGLPANGQAYTLEGWVKPQLPSSYMSWVAYGPLNYTGSFIGSDLQITPGADSALETWDPANFVGTTIAFDLGDGYWHYVALTDDGAGTQKFYVDGLLALTATTTASNGLVYASSNVLALGDPGQVGGVFVAPAQEPYTGALAHIAIYPAVLSAAQVSAHYAASGYTIPPRLVLSPTSGVAGSFCTASLAYFPPSTAFSVTFNGASVGTGTTDSVGVASAFFIVPSAVYSAATVVATAGAATGSAPFSVLFTMIVVGSLAGHGTGYNVPLVGPGIWGPDPTGWHDPGFDDSAWEAMIQETALGSDYVTDTDPGSTGSMWARKIAGTFWIVPTSLNGDLFSAQATWLHRLVFSAPSLPAGGTLVGALVQAWPDNHYTDIWVNGHDTGLSVTIPTGSGVGPDPSAFDPTWITLGASNLLAIKMTSTTGPTSVDYQLTVHYTLVPVAVRTPRNQVYWKR